MQYTELQVTTNFSFLKGASHPEELVERAIALGFSEIAITDTNTFAGIVRAHAATRNTSFRIIPGVHLLLHDSSPLLAYPVSAEGYAQLCELLTRGNLRTEKGDCLLYQSDLAAGLDEVLFIALPPQQLSTGWTLDPEFVEHISIYKKYFPGRLYIAAQRRYNSDDHKFLFRLDEFARQQDLPLVATNDVFYHIPERRQLQDLLTCVREKCSIQTAGLCLCANAERYLKTAAEMNRLFSQYPEAITNTQRIAEACRFSISELKYEYPEEITPEGVQPQEALTQLTWEGARQFYGENIPEKIIASIRHELAFIQEMNYAPYFLTVYDIVKFARDRGILCQGRGSAANSTVCFCLGITSVNPAKFDLLFERFLSAARNEPPDIDVDFEHERREEVIQYIYEKYGRHRAAIVATVTQLHRKGAIRDIAKAMGLSLDLTEKISATVMRYGSGGFDLQQLAAEGINIKDKHLLKVLDLTHQYIGFPRQLGQHTGGFVISRKPLSRLCPVLNARMENRTCIEWNKDDIEVLGFLKIDILALGMLTCIRKAFVLARESYNQHFTLANIPQDDPAVYDMICKADTIGVFQIESRAQQSMLPRLKPRCFYDLVIEVAIVRPGPIQGDMVHPYLRRRNGEEPVVYPSKELEEILSRTLGVPLFQEQAMKVAIVAAGFTPSEADALRRSMATFKAKGKVSYFEKKLVDGMIARGYPVEYAQRVFRQLEGFGSYGFPESHAASFALLVYVSSWLKCHYPDVFACALLNSLPMGFYQPAQIVTDARQHGVEVRPVDINHSFWDNTLEEVAGKYRALRLGFRQVSGLRQDEIEQMIHQRTQPFQHIFQLLETGLGTATLEKLADADSFGSIGLNRRQALWELSVKDKPEALFSGIPLEEKGEKEIRLPEMALPEQVMQDYASTSLSLKAHPVSFLREKMDLLNVTRNGDLGKGVNGQFVKVAGLILVRQRPETAKGVWFITLEDETATANLVVFPDVVEKFRKTFIQSRMIMVEGKLQVEGQVIHVVVTAGYDFTPMLSRLLRSRKMALPSFPRSDEVVNGKASRPPKEKTVLPGGRNFH